MSESKENFINESPVELPEISYEMNEFVRLYAIENLTGTESYRLAYNSHAKTSTCCVEASRLLKNPKITLWIEFYRKTKQEHIKNSIEYTIDDAMKEFDDLKIIALESCDQYGRPNVSAANKAVEMKCKLKGLMDDDSPINNSVVVEMGDVKINGNPLELMIGEDVNECAGAAKDKQTDSSMHSSCDS